MTNSHSLLKGMRFGHSMSSCIFFSPLLATSWPKLRFVRINWVLLSNFSVTCLLLTSNTTFYFQAWNSHALHSRFVSLLIAGSENAVFVTRVGSLFYTTTLKRFSYTWFPLEAFKTGRVLYRVSQYLIHEADPQSRPIVITVYARVVFKSVRPFPRFKIKSSSKNIDRYLQG